MEYTKLKRPKAGGGRGVPLLPYGAQRRTSPFLFQGFLFPEGKEKPFAGDEI